jgi:hypothetical protein
MQGEQRDAPKGWAPLLEWIEYAMHMATETERADVGKNQARSGAHRQPALTRRQRRRLRRPGLQQAVPASPTMANHTPVAPLTAEAESSVRPDAQTLATAAPAIPAVSPPDGAGAEMALARQRPPRTRPARASRPVRELPASSDPLRAADATLRSLAPREPRAVTPAPSGGREPENTPAAGGRTQGEAAHGQSAPSSAQAVAQRLVMPLRASRRPKTLADAVRALRPATPRADVSSADDDTLPSLPRAETRPAAAAYIVGGALDAATGRVERDSAPVDARVDARDAANYETRPVATPGGARHRMTAATRPIAAGAPITTPVRRPAPDQVRARGSAGPAVADTPTSPRFLSAVRRGSVRFAMEVAIWHAVAGLLAALAGSALLLGEQPLGGWILTLAGLLIAGAAGAYALLHLRRSARWATIIVVTAQLAALTWAYLLIGPQIAVVLLLPAAIWLAFRAGGRAPAVLSGVGGACVYAWFLFLTAGTSFRPAFVPGIQAHIALDAGAVVIGVGLTVAAIVGTASAFERSEAAARARLYELRLLRADMARLRHQTEEDGQLLEESLARALRGRSIDPITIDSTLSPVAEGVNAVAERLATLQKDREDRLRLEGALRSLMRALERARLGLAWGWPEASGTALDELVALMRTARPPQRHASVSGPDETPTLVPMPVAGALRSHAPGMEAHAARPDASSPGMGWGGLLGS